MSRYQIVVHLRNNQGFSLDNLIQLEALLCDREELNSVEFDGHDYGENDSNMFLFSDESEKTIDIVVKFIEGRFPDLNFVVGAKMEGAETGYDLIASRGIYEIIMQ